MADVLELLGIPEVNTGLQSVVANIVAVEKEIETCNAKTLKIEIDAKNLESLNEVIALTKQQGEQINALTNAQNNNTQAVQQNTQVNGAQAASVNNLSNEAAVLQKQIKATEKAWAQFGMGSTSINQKFQAEIDALKGKIASLQGSATGGMNKITESVKKTDDSFKVMGINVESLMARMAIRMVAMQLLFLPIIAGAMLLFESWLKVGDAEQIATDRMKAYFDAFLENQKNMQDSVPKSLTEIFGAQQDYDLQKKIMLDHNKTLDERFNAYQKMVGIAPKVVDAMDKDTFAAKMNSDALKEAAENGNKFIEVQKQLAQAQKSRDEHQQLVLSNAETQGDIQKEINKVKGESGSGNPVGIGIIKFNENKLKEARREQDLNKKNLQTDLDDVEKLTNALSAMEGKTKDKKGKKANAKGLDAALFKEQQEYEKALAKIQAEYDKSHHLIGVDDVKKLKADEDAMREHTANKISIIVEWHGRAGELEDKFKGRIIQAQKDMLDVENATNEAERKIALEVQKRHDAENEKLDKTIAKLVEQRIKLREIDEELKNIRENAKIDHNTASGFSPYLEALGFDSGFKGEQAKKDAAIKKAQTHISNIQGDKANYDKTEFADPATSLKFDEDISKERNNIAQLEADKQAALDAKVISAKKAIAEQTIQLAQTTYDAVKTIQDNAFAHEQQQLEIQMESTRLQGEQKMRAIEASTNYAITKDNQLATQAAATLARENEIQQQQNKNSLRKAEFDKKQAEEKILLDTAVGVMKVWAEYADVPILAAALSAVVAGIGAAQYSAAESTPLPQFKGGTGDKGTYTEKFIAGEAGRELGVTPSGQFLMFDKPGIYSEKIGTKIYKNEDTERLLKHSIYGNYPMLKPQIDTMTDKNIVDEVRDLNQSVVGALYMTRQQAQKIENKSERFYYSKMFRR